MTLLQALETINGFSKPSKMPCHSWSIPAKDCKTGSKLAKVEGSVCADCYAMSGFYRMGNVKSCLEKRLESLSNPKWENAMTIAISGSEGSGFFRWFDSGDIQSLAHLKQIAQIAKNLPSIQFWLPTKEYGIVTQYLQENELPENLTIRLSGFMVDGPAPIALASRLGLVTSTVVSEGFTCPASSQGNKCLSCRACWDKGVSNVAYKHH
jgi:hypothetical protein